MRRMQVSVNQFSHHNFHVAVVFEKYDFHDGVTLKVVCDNRSNYYILFLVLFYIIIHDLGLPELEPLQYS